MRLLSIPMLFCLLISADGAADAVKKDMDRLEGEFSMVSGEANGVAMPDNFLKGSRRVAKDGVTTVTIVVWLVVWFFLGRAWANKTVDIGKVNLVSFALLAVGFLLTFPPFIDLLQGK